MSLLSSSPNHVKGVLAIDIDETLAAPGDHWNEFLISLLIQTKRNNPNLDIVLFSSYHPGFFQEHLKHNIGRTQVVSKLSEKGLVVDNVLLTESNQYENSDRKFGDFFHHIISPIEAILQDNPSTHTAAFDIISQLIQDTNKKLLDSNIPKPTKGDHTSEERYKAQLSEQLQILIQSATRDPNAPLPGVLGDILKKYKNSFKMIGFKNDDAVVLARNLIISQLTILLNVYSKQYILDPSNKRAPVKPRSPGEPFSGNEAKEMMMRHLKDQGYTHVFLIDDSYDVGNLFRLQDHDEKSQMTDGIKPDDTLLQNVSGFQFVGLKNFDAFKTNPGFEADIARTTEGLTAAVSAFSAEISHLQAGAHLAHQKQEAESTGKQKEKRQRQPLLLASHYRSNEQERGSASASLSAAAAAAAGVPQSAKSPQRKDKDKKEKKQAHGKPSI